MDRRTTIKSLIVFVSVGLSSFSFYKWTTFNSSADAGLLDQKKTILSELAEVIIPRTDTPGAKDAKVEEFIIGMIKYCTEARTQHNFIDGLADLEQYVMKNYNKEFISCTEKEKISILKYYEQKTIYRSNFINKVNNKFFGVPFFVRLKQLTVEGYCTSRIGAEQGLAYDYIPVTYQACIPVINNQRSWATK